MGKSFEGRVALVTGATSGLGRALALAFAREGADVAVTGRRADLLEAVAKEVRGHGVRCAAIAGDARREAHANDAVARTVAELGGLTILVNNAGVIGSGPVESTTTAEWDRVLDTDLKGPFFFCRAAIPHLKAAKGANIVNVCSVAGVRPYANLAPYCVAKAGLDLLTECLALELAPAHVRVNSINPGVIVTNLHKASNAVPDYEAFLERGKSTHPLGFVGAPEDAVELVLFLASDKARWITGAHHALDGGRALTSLR
jgi:NAD(P)-dependent dehydrogenase (short-subunit alcohol dehydrogenase family)